MVIDTQIRFGLLVINNFKTTFTMATTLIAFLATTNTFTKIFTSLLSRGKEGARG